MALQELEKSPVDLVISDFLMAEMNGLDFLQQVKKMYPDVPCILLTGYADKENAIKAINEIGLFQYIEKPWGFEEILETNSRYTVKRLFMKKGHQCSCQYHKKKKETAIVLSGDLTVVIEDTTLDLKTGDLTTLRTITKHRMEA